MATGYTMNIKDGISFKDFVTKCAGAFMHPEAKLEEEKPNKYYKKSLDKSIKILKKAKKNTLKEAEIHTKKEHKDEIKKRIRYIKEEKELKEKYDSMLEKVYAWKLPSVKHRGLKKFMIEQIESSIKHDCKGYWKDDPEHVEEKPERWLKEHIKFCERDVKRDKKSWKEEVERTEHNNMWVRQLKESLENL